MWIEADERIGHPKRSAPELDRGEPRASHDLEGMPGRPDDAFDGVESGRFRSVDVGRDRRARRMCKVGERLDGQAGGGSGAFDHVHGLYDIVSD